jgi:Zn-dependent protease
MDGTANQVVTTIAIYALPVLLAISLHEVAHGYVARHFGDRTAHAEGRISLNPLRHMHWLGTVVVPLVVLYFTSWKFLFGWAKPVPVNYSALRNPRWHMALVAAAGPAANLLMLLAWAILLKAVVELPRGFYTAPMVAMAEAGIVINLVFMAINLLPILPLDGGRILLSLVPRWSATQYAKMEQWSGHVLTVFVLLAVFDGMANEGKLLARSFAPLGDLAATLVRAIVYG